MNVCERGIAAMIAGELLPGESVGVELRLSTLTDPLRTRATVRYQDKLRCGLEFVAMSAEQRAAIRDWAKGAKAEPEMSAGSGTVVDKVGRKDVAAVKDTGASRSGDIAGRRRKKRRRLWWLVALILIAIAAGVFWWKWNRAWDELESGLKRSENASVDKPKLRVPTEVMQKLLVHRVEAVYPPEARKQNIQGIIALDIVVAKDGSVVSMKALNGPDVLANAAMDALRWWKFDPYRVNGEPAEVETTVAVEFKK